MILEAMPELSLADMAETVFEHHDGPLLASKIASVLRKLELRLRGTHSPLSRWAELSRMLWLRQDMPEYGSR